MKRLLVVLITISSFVSFATTASASTKGMNRKVRHWYLHEYGKRDAKLIVLDQGKIVKDYITLSKSSSQSAAKSEASVLGQACEKTLQDLANISVNLKPVPNKKLEKRWSKALKDMKNGAASCNAGAMALDSTELNRGGRQLNAAGKMLKKLPFIRDLFVKKKS